MTGKTSDPEPNAAPPTADLAQFLDDWAALWRGEMRARAGDPSDPLSEAGEMWRAAMTTWTGSFAGAARDRSATPRTEAAVAASDTRDAEIECLTRRVDELEARLARLETARRARR
jgi:hypothetical protein